MSDKFERRMRAMAIADTQFQQIINERDEARRELAEARRRIRDLEEPIPPAFRHAFAEEE